MKLRIIILLTLSLFSAVFAQDDFADEAEISALTQISLPAGTFNVRDQNIPAEYKQLLKKYVGDDPALRLGRSELLVLTGGDSPKPDFEKLRSKVEGNFRNSGWNYEVHGQEKNITFFTAIKKSPTRINIFGYWVFEKKGLMLVMTEVIDAQSVPATDNNSPTLNQTPNRSVSGSSQVCNLSSADENVNVMGELMPPLPSFPPLTKNPGKIRGYVKDTSGKALGGAAIALGSIRIGSSRMVTQTVTDSKGYYELDLPLNSNKFQYAAYAVDYGAGKAAMALHPADGSIEDNPPGEGGIENFVLLPYGIADRSTFAKNSNYGASYYGGSIALFINVGYVGANDSLNKGRFYPGSQIEITLAPLGALIDGSASKTFIIRKKIGEDTRNELFINNVPVGKYKLSVKSNGKPVGMKQRLPENSIFGIKPTETNNGEADILFYPGSGKPTEIGAGSGGWQNVEIYLEAL
jgi:hypothetical protein